MPSIVLSACLLLFAATIVDSDATNRLGLDDFLTYYAPASGNFRSDEPILDHQHHPDTSRSLNSPNEVDSANEDANDSFFHDSAVYSKSSPLASSSGKSVLDSHQKDLRTDTMNEKQEEEELGHSRRLEPIESLSALMSKRAGLEDRQFLKELYYRRFHPNSNSWATKELKRERNGGMGPSLSVDSSLDVVRDQFIRSLIRNRMIEKQKQIESNVKLLSEIGKRGGSQSSRSQLKQLSSQ